MSRSTIRIRRACALLALLGLAAALTACDSGGSTASSTSTTTTHRRPRRAHTSTTTTTTGHGTSSTTATTPTTVASGQTGPGGTNPPASAACGAQEARLSAVVTGGDLAAVPVERYTVTDCRLSPTHQIWGAVTLTPNPGETVPTLTVVFERVGSLWTVHSSGEGPTGCDAPAPAPAELRLGC